MGLLALGKLPKLIVFSLLYERLESVELIDAKDKKQHLRFSVFGEKYIFEFWLDVFVE